MRFITEFETTYEGSEHPNYEKYVSAYKGRGELEIASKIGELFGWKEDQQRFKIQNTLEIEAFPMDKWLEFKRKINDHMLAKEGIVSGTHLLRLIEWLESSGRK